MEKVGAKASMGLILNPQTGAILSMVNLPDYNPNSPNDFDIELQKNKIVTDLIEPGSTFKIVTMAAALESDIALNDEYNVEGPYNFHNIKISVKHSNVPLMIESYRLLAEKVDYPLHLGVTEAGPLPGGLIKSTAGTLLKQKIESKAENDSILKMADKYNE